MANVYMKCAYCDGDVLLPDAKPATTLNAEQVRVALIEMRNAATAFDYEPPDRQTSYMEAVRNVLATLETMHREFLNAERTDDGPV